MVNPYGLKYLLYAFFASLEAKNAFFFAPQHPFPCVSVRSGKIIALPKRYMRYKDMLLPRFLERGRGRDGKGSKDARPA